MQKAYCLDDSIQSMVGHMGYNVNKFIDTDGTNPIQSIFKYYPQFTKAGDIKYEDVISAYSGVSTQMYNAV
jgi:hypothetical protein